jgi:hypothetical protein
MENNKIIYSKNVKKGLSHTASLYSFVEKNRQNGFIVASIDSTLQRNDTLFAFFF